MRPVDPEVGLPAAIVLLAVLALLPVLYGRTWRRRSAKLLRHLRGRISPVTGQVAFDFEGIRFHLDRISTGSGAGNRGSYPCLWTIVDAPSTLFVGHPGSVRYAFVREPRRFSGGIVSGDAPCRIVAESDEALGRIRAALEGAPGPARDLALLFDREFAHLRIRTEVHVGGGALFRRRRVLRYIGTPESVYDEPSRLEERLRALVRLLGALGVSPGRGDRG